MLLLSQKHIQSKFEVAVLFQFWRIRKRNDLRNYCPEFISQCLKYYVKGFC